MSTITDTWMNAPETTTLGEASRPDAPSEVLTLFSAHGPALYRFCLGTLNRVNDAEDVVQETFLKLLQHLRSGGDRSNLRAWLFAVAVNACRDRVRWRRRWLPWRVEFDHRAVEPVEGPSGRGRAFAALRALRGRDRMLLALRAQGLSYREIAAASGIAEPSVGRLLSRAVERWKKEIL